MLAECALPAPVVCALRLQRVLPKENLSLGAKPSALGADSHNPGLCPRPSNCFQDDDRKRSGQRLRWRRPGNLASGPAKVLWCVSFLAGSIHAGGVSAQATRAGLPEHRAHSNQRLPPFALWQQRRTCSSARGSSPRAKRLHSCAPRRQRPALSTGWSLARPAQYRWLKPCSAPSFACRGSLPGSLATWERPSATTTTRSPASCRR